MPLWHKLHEREVGAGRRMKRSTVKESREMGYRARLRMAIQFTLRVTSLGSMGTTNRNTAPPRCYDAQDRTLSTHTQASSNFHGRGNWNSQCLDLSPLY